MEELSVCKTKLEYTYTHARAHTRTQTVVKVTEYKLGISEDIDAIWTDIQLNLFVSLLFFFSSGNLQYLVLRQGRLSAHSTADGTVSVRCL